MERSVRGGIRTDGSVSAGGVAVRQKGVGVLWCYGLFFFFQAEDGIRDYKVTGVQTCALPISQRELVSINSGGAAATRDGQYKKRGRCHSENWSV